MTRPRRPGAGNRLVVRAAAALAMLGGFLAVLLGWVSRPRAWEQATGWERIPADQRPPDGPAWTARAGEGEPPRIAWLGHSGFVIRWKAACILLDPDTSRRCTITRRVIEDAGDVGALGRVDAVLVSHAHFDHLDMPTMLKLRELGHVVLPRGAESYFDGARFARTTFDPLEPGECVSIAGLEICGVVAQHEGNRAHPFAGRVGALGYVVRSGGEAIYYSGDTGAAIPFEAIRDRFHPRLAILPIGAWLPRFPMKRYHLSPAEAADAAARLQVETMIPCHFGTFLLSGDRPDAALPRFAAAAKARGVAWRMPRLLGVGEEAGP